MWRPIHPLVRSALAAVGGPALIVTSVLVVHHRMAFGGYVTDQHIDILPMWLPTHCFLGGSLAAGHVPAWNPHVLSGTPFAADPQSGWTYLPAMLLYAVLSCDVAIRWFIVLQPVLAGLGVYGFLRAEEVSRPASTVGGLALSVLMAGSFVGLALPFAGTLAWTALMLCAAAWALRARSTPVRLVLVVATAVAWGQIANAHLSHGLVVGTLALATYLVGRAVSPRSTRGDVGRLAGLLVLALPLVNLAVLLPRLAYLPRTTIGLGYPELQRLAGELTGLVPIPFARGPAAEVTWPLWLTSSPGSYVGVAALALAFAGLIGGRRRALAIAFAAFGAACYILSLEAFANAVADLAVKLPFGDFYLHEPDRFRYGVLLAVCTLAGLGADAWVAERSPLRRAVLLAPGVLIWGVIAAAFGVARPEPWVTAVGVVLSAAALALIAVRRERPVLAWLLPAVLAVEMVAGGLAGQTDAYLHEGVEKPGEYEAFPPLRRPEVDAAAYLEPGPFVGALGARYTTVGGEGVTRRGYLTLQEPAFWPALANQRAVMFDLSDASGYNPTQLAGYWKFVRLADPKRMRYNASYLQEVSPLVRDLLGIASVIAPVGTEVPGASPVAGEGGFVLHRFQDVSGLASFHERFVVVGSQDGALRRTTSAPDAEVVFLEDQPSLPVGGSGGKPGLSARWVGPSEIVINSATGSPGIVLVRVPYDRNWRVADADGEGILRVDGFLIGLATDGSARSWRLRYDDPAIGYGVLGSGLALAGFLGAAGWIAFLGRRRRGAAPKVEPGEDAGGG